MMLCKKIATLKKWKWAGQRRLTGEVYGHPNFGDGTVVTTSRLMSVDFEKMQAETLNTIYKLEENP